MSWIEDERDGAVGYGRPPKSTRFQKGRSGNPKGRPKKAVVEPPLPALEPTSAALLASGSRMLTATENGKAVQLSSSEAMMRAYERLALSGNRLALKDLIHLRREEEAIAAAEHRRIFDYWRKTKEGGEGVLAQARRKELPEPTLYPHPDDIQLDYGTMDVKIVGPMTSEEAAIYRHNADLVRHGTRVATYYGELSAGADKDRRGRPTIGAFTLTAELISLRLPERLRPTVHELASLVMEARVTPRRVLAKELAEEGARLGAEFHPVHATMPAPMLPICELPRLLTRRRR